MKKIEKEKMINNRNKTKKNNKKENKSDKKDKKNGNNVNNDIIFNNKNNINNVQKLKKRKENPNKVNNEIIKRKKRKLQQKRKKPPQDINIDNNKNDNNQQNTQIDIIESFKELDEKKSFGISKIDPVKIVSIQNLISKKNNPFISVYVCDVLNYIVQILIFGEDALTFGYKIGDNVQLQFDNQNVSKGKYHKGVLKIQIVHCKFKISLLQKEIKLKINKLSNVIDLTSQGQKYFNFIVKITDTEKIGSKPFKKHEVFDETNTAMLVEWNSFNYKGLTFNIEQNNIYLIISAEVSVHEKYGINLQNYVITKPSIFSNFKKNINQLKDITKQSSLNITKDSFENIGATNAFKCIKHQKFSKYNNIILYGCQLALFDLSILYGKNKDGEYIGHNQLFKLDEDEFNQTTIEYGIKINIIDEEKNVWEDGYINNKLAIKLLNIQAKDFLFHNNDFKNNIFKKMTSQKYDVFINFFAGKNNKIKFKICHIDVNNEQSELNVDGDNTQNNEDKRDNIDIK